MEDTASVRSHVTEGTETSSHGTRYVFYYYPGYSKPVVNFNEQVREYVRNKQQHVEERERVEKVEKRRLYKILRRRGTLTNDRMLDIFLENGGIKTKKYYKCIFDEFVNSKIDSIDNISYCERVIDEMFTRSGGLKSKVECRQIVDDKFTGNSTDKRFCQSVINQMY